MSWGKHMSGKNERLEHGECLSGSCEHCILNNDINGEEYLFCEVAIYPVNELYDDHGACPNGQWMKSPSHYRRIVETLDELKHMGPFLPAWQRKSHDGSKIAV